MVYINHEQPLPHLTLQQLCYAQQHHAQYCIVLFQYFLFSPSVYWWKAYFKVTITSSLFQLLLIFVLNTQWLEEDLVRNIHSCDLFSMKWRSARKKLGEWFTSPDKMMTTKGQLTGNNCINTGLIMEFISRWGACLRQCSLLFVFQAIRCVQVPFFLLFTLVSLC